MANQFTLAELAEQTGVQPRTIRSYIEQGLLRGPEIGGRGARYSEYHLQRLQAIRVLKDVRGLPLSEVRQRLLKMTGPEIAALAEEAGIAGAPLDMPEALSALEYLRSIQPRAAAPEPAPPPPSASPLDVLLARLDRLAGGGKPKRKARGQVWTVIPVSQDVEIRVRGALTSDELARWERIADHLREILLGGAREE